MVMSRDEVRAFDSWAINELGIAGVVLMENAGRSCAKLVMENLAGPDGSMACIFCGAGNNGGDGYVIARHLINNGYGVTAVLCCDKSRVESDAKANLEILEGMGQEVVEIDIKTEVLTGRVAELCEGCDIIVDAIFGTGLAGEVRADYAGLIDAINAQGKKILAVDIPSGLDCDTGKPLGIAIKAEQTVTFVAVKKGFAENPDSQTYTGDLYVASIGVEPEAWSL